jgi:cytoskeletal protein RodZ
MKMRKYTSIAAVNDSTSTPPPPEKRSRKKGLIALIVIAIVVVAAAVGAYAVLNNGSNNNNNSTPTPTPTHTTGASSTPSSSTSSTPTSSTPSSNGVATASSLQFSIDVTSGGVKQFTYTYMAKNAGTNNLMLRIETTDSSGTTSIYIVNGVLQKAWTYDGTEWTDISSTYSMQYNTWDASFVGYQNSLTSWAGAGGYTYTAPNGDSVRYYDIAVNPNLSDSLFEHT